MGSPDGGYGGEGGYGEMGGGMYGAMPGGYGTGGDSGYLGTVTIPSSFDQRHFSAICNLAMSCLLGVLGGIVAQWLYATRRD